MSIPVIQTKCCEHTNKIEELNNIIELYEKNIEAKNRVIRNLKKQLINANTHLDQLVPPIISGLEDDSPKQDKIYYLRPILEDSEEELFI